MSASNQARRLEICTGGGAQALVTGQPMMTCVARSRTAQTAYTGRACRVRAASVWSVSTVTSAVKIKYE